MCLIVSAPKGNMIPFELLEDATLRNDDGWGVMWHDGNRIQVHKDPKPSAQAIYDLTKNNPHQTLVHLRMTTHGDNSHENTHPFEIIENRLYMMHNGIISVDAPRHLKRSDTRVVVEDYLKPLVTKPGRLHNPGIRNFIQNLIGTSSNRLAFLDEQGNVTFFNKNLGMEWKGLWCSNTYAWSLHDEDKPKKKLYQTYKDWSHGLDDYRYDSWFSHSPKSVKDLQDDFKWADRDTQADVDDDAKLDDEIEVTTNYGFKVPMWIASYLEAEYDQLSQCDPESLAAVIEYLRDNYIGDPL